MKRSALVGLVFLLLPNANAGSAVAVGHSNHQTLVVKSYGLPQKVAERHVIEICHRLGGVDARLLASTEVVGECAIAVGRRGNGSVIGVSLGRPTAVDAQARAIEQCRRAGGTDPKVKWGFRG